MHTMAYVHSFTTGRHAVPGLHSFRQNALRQSHLARAPRSRKACTSQADYEVDSSSDLLALLVDQAREAPVVQLSPPAQQYAPQQHQAEADAYGQHTSKQQYSTTASTAPSTPEAAEQQQFQLQPAWHAQQQTISMPQKRRGPSGMDFQTMYQQLAEWQKLYLTAHVPRFCFDAPELGAWVRYMRKQYKEGVLELWKVDRLNALQFEWDLTDQDAKWHHNFHQLRRYRALHGNGRIDAALSKEDGCDWAVVEQWLTQQGRLLAKQKLSGHKRDMLAQLGVTLHLPKRLLHRTAQLQALNGMERRKLRKKWKKLDQAAAERRREEQHQQWQLRQEQQRQQQLVAARRRELLRDAGVQAGTAAAAFQLQDQQLGFELAQVTQQHRLELIPDQQQQQQQQRGTSLVQQHNWQQHDIQQLVGNEGRLQQQGPSTAVQTSDERGAISINAAAAAAEGNISGSVPGPPADAEQQAATESQQPGQQQQQQQPRAMFYRRNRRTKRVKQTTKQEKWLLQQQEQQS